MGLGDHLAEKSDPCTMPPPATCWGGSPCFSSQAPAPIKTFLQTLPPLENRRAFVFVTSGGAPGRVLYDLARLLQDKGAEVVDGFLAREELHHPAPCLIGRIPSCPNVDDLVRARRFAIAVAEHVLTGHHGPVAASRPDVFRPRWGFYGLVALLSTDGFLRRVLSEPKLDTSRCSQCQWCVYECPMHNITLQPYSVLGDQCIRCYRCLTLGSSQILGCCRSSLPE